MKNRTIPALLLLGTLSLSAQTPRPADTRHIRPAFTIAKGHLIGEAQMRFFFQDEITELSTGLLTGETYWDIQSGLALHYGLSHSVELHLLQIIYQDNHKKGPGYNLPDDLFLGFQTHLWQNRPGTWRSGAQLQLRLPVAEHHNVPLEPYSSGRVGAGVTMLASHLSRPDSPGLGLTLSSNLGFYHHNDRGTRITNVPGSSATARRHTIEMVYGIAAQQTLNSWAFFAELSGRHFLQKPPATAYTRENSLYLSPGISLTLPSHLRLRAAVDVRLSGDHDETTYGPDGLAAITTPWDRLPNHPDWRINFSLQLPIYPAPFSKDRIDPIKKEQQDQIRAEKEERVLDVLTRERQKAEEAEKELARMQAERQRIEEALKRVRELLQPPAPEEKPNQAP